MKRLIFINCFFLLVFTGKSQTIENVDFKFIDDKISIYYDLVDCVEGFKYEVEIKFIDDKGNTVVPRGNLTGDYGIVACGKNKKAVWDLFKEIESFEGNYKTIIKIINIYNRRNELVRDKTMKFIKSTKDNDQIKVELKNGVNDKIEINDIFFITSNEKITLSTSEKTLKIGKLKISESNKTISKGVLSINEQLNYDQINITQRDLRFSKYHKYNIYCNSLIFTPGVDVENFKFGFGFGFETSTMKNNNHAGLEINYLLFWGESFGVDFNLFYVISTYALNSNNFSLGFNLHPLSIKTEDATMKPRIGIFSGLQFGHVRYKLGLEFGKTEYYTGSYQNGDPYNGKTFFNIYSSLSFSLFK